MVAQGYGAIVTVSSSSALTGGTSGAHYAAAKGGVLSFRRALARELAPHGVRVNTVIPAKVETDMLRPALQADTQALAASIPLGRWGQPTEMAEVDRRTVDDLGVALPQLMELAGRALGRLAQVRFLADVCDAPPRADCCWERVTRSVRRLTWGSQRCSPHWYRSRRCGRRGRPPGGAHAPRRRSPAPAP